MGDPGATSSDPAWAPLGGMLAGLEALYKDVHSHPELSMQETRTARRAAERLRSAGVGAALCFGLRVLAIRHGWQLPVARPDRE